MRKLLVKQYAKGGTPDDGDYWGEYDTSKPVSKPVGKSVKGLAKGLNKAVPYLSNIANTFRRLPEPSAPQQESYINPSLVNYDATRGKIQNNLANFNRETDYKVSGRTLAQGLKAKALAGATEGLNEAAQQEGNTNALIKNQTAQFNQGTQARNAERVQNYNDARLARTLKQQEFDAENLADTGNKFQLQQHDENMFELEKRKLGIIPKFYENGVYNRNLGAEHDQAIKNLGEFGGYMEMGGDIDDIKLKTQLLKERQAKRDSVRSELETKHNGNFPKVNEGMLQYYQTEPSHYRTLDVGAYKKTLHPFGGPTDPTKPYSIVPWSKQGVTSADTLSRGTMYKMPYSVQSKLYKTGIPKGVDPSSDSYMTVTPGGMSPDAAMKSLGPGVDFHDVLGNKLSHDQMGSTVTGLKFGGIHIKPSHKGRFTAWKARTGETTERALHSSNPHVRQMANFARNAAKWHHKFGGERMEGWDSELENAGAEGNLTLLGSNGSDVNIIGSKKFKRIFK